MCLRPRARWNPRCGVTPGCRAREKRDGTDDAAYRARIGSILSGAVMSHGRPPSIGLCDELPELFVVANVVFGIVRLGCENQKHSFARVVILNGPYPRWNMETSVGAIERDFLSLLAVVHDCDVSSSVRHLGLAAA